MHPRARAGAVAQLAGDLEAGAVVAAQRVADADDHDGVTHARS